MKKRLFLGLSVTALMVLAACNFGGNNSSDAGDNSLPDSSQNEAGSSNSDVSSFSGASSVVSSANSSNDSKPSSSTSSSQADPDWLAREKDIFKNYFYGVTIPFPNLKGLKVLSYDEEDGVAFTYGGTSTPEFLASYAALYDNSWEDDSTAGTEGVTSYYYSKTKKVTTAEGDRYVEVLFCGVNLDTGYFTSDGTGSFYIQISDPYKYSWPKTDVDAALELFGATDTVPAYAADRYVVNDRYLTTNNLLAVFAFTTDVEAQTKYGAQLVAAGYTLKGTSSDDFDIYYSVNEQVEVDVHYEEDEQVLDIYIGKITNSGGGSGSSVTSWPANLVETFLRDVLETEEDLPAFTGGTSYEIHDSYMDEGMLWMYIDSTENAFNAYETALENAGYEYQTTDSYGDDIYLSPLGEIEVDVGFDPEENVVDLWIMAGDDIGGGEEEYEAFPAEELAGYISELLGSDEEIPSFDYSVTPFMYDNKDTVPYVNIYCLSDGDYTQRYGDKLLDAGWEFDGKGSDGNYYFISPEGELVLAYSMYASSQYPGYYFWDCYILNADAEGGETGGDGEYTAFPAAQLASYVKSYLGSDEVVPAFDYAITSFYYENDPDEPCVNIYCLTDDDRTDDYEQVLVDAGWELLGYDEDDFCYYSSPEGTIELVFGCYPSETSGAYYWDCYLFEGENAGGEEGGEGGEEGGEEGGNTTSSTVYTPATLTTPGYGTKTTTVYDAEGNVVSESSVKVNEDAWTCASAVSSFFEYLTGTPRTANAATLSDGTEVLYFGGNFGTNYTLAQLMSYGTSAARSLTGFATLQATTTDTDGSMYAVFYYANEATDTLIFMQVTAYTASNGGNVLQVMCYLESYSEALG